MLSSFVSSFCEAAPYIHYLRGKTLVIGIASSLLSGETIHALASDLNLLSVLGVRLVLVHSATQQISKICQQNQKSIQFHQHRRICDADILQYAKQVCGEIQFDLQAALSCGLAHTPQRLARIRVATGNFLSAKPLGVLDGVDMGYAGQVRKTDAAAIHRALDDGVVVLVSPLGTSASGQGYCLAMSDTAAAVASALQAEKLIYLGKQDGIMVSDNLKAELNAHEVIDLLENADLSDAHRQILQNALTALEQGVSRVQVLSGQKNGALIQELFTRHGVGTSIARAPFMHIRSANEHDIADILAMTRPLEARGVLKPRNHDYFAEHISEFFVLENDRQIYGCVALKLFTDAPKIGELACLVVSPHARDSGYGEELLAYVIDTAKKIGIKKLLALSTHTADWFLERGFQAATFADLPPERQTEYAANLRQSKIFLKDLS